MKTLTEDDLDANEVEDEELETYDYDQRHLSFNSENLQICLNLSFYVFYF